MTQKIPDRMILIWIIIEIELILQKQDLSFLSSENNFSDRILSRELFADCTSSACERVSQKLRKLHHC